MAEEPKPGRNIKDLKARLGKGPKPPEAGRASSPPVPPSSLGGGIGSVPPPMISGAGPAPGVAPPFGMTRSSSRPPGAPTDPFAPGAEPARPQEVRLVIDEKPLEESEAIKRRRSLSIITAIVGFLAGGAIAWAVTSTVESRKIWDASMADGRTIREAVISASQTVERAQGYVRTAVAAARGGPGKQPAVDYRAIEALRALKKPFDASIYQRRNYFHFSPETVDSLIDYHANVVDLWRRIDTFSARTLAPQRREALNRAALAADELATTQTGCVPSLTGDRITCGIVFVTIPPVQEGQPSPTVAQVSTRRGATQTFEKTIYVDGDLGETPDQFVIINDLTRSIGVLGESASAFAEYARDLGELSTILTKTVEVQGRLITGLGSLGT